MIGTVQRYGFTYRDPHGLLGCVLYPDKDGAITAAAMAFNDRGYCSLPADWEKAQKAGYSVVSAALIIAQIDDSYRSTPAFAKGGR